MKALSFYLVFLLVVVLAGIYTVKQSLPAQLSRMAQIEAIEKGGR